MKFSSARGPARSRVPLIAMLALAASIGIAGCTNDGSGPAGPDDGGDSGGTGPTGPTGPADVPITLGGDVKNVGTGAGLTAQQIADIGTLIATIDSAAVTGNKAVIEFTLKTPQGGKVLGLAPTTLRLGVAKLVPAADGSPSRWQNYINRAAAPSITSPKLTSAIQANTESGVAAGWTELGLGKYRYTSAVDLSNVTTPINRRLRALVDAPRQPGDRPVGQSGPTLARTGQPLQGLRAEWRDRLEQARRRDRELRRLPRTLRRARRPAPQRRILRCVPQPRDDRSGLRRVGGHGLHGPLDSPRRGAHDAYVVYGFNGTEFNDGRGHLSAAGQLLRDVPPASACTPQGDDWKSFPTAAACGGCHDAGLNKTGPSATTGRYTYTFTHPSARPAAGATRLRTATARAATGRAAPAGTCSTCTRRTGTARPSRTVNSSPTRY